MTYKIKMKRVYETYFTIEAETPNEAMDKFQAIPDEDKYNEELEQMNVDEDITLILA